MAHPLTLFLLLSDPFPVLGTQYQASDFCPLDLSVNFLDRENLSFGNMDALEQYVDQLAKKHNAQFAYGGYLEHRNLYQAPNYIYTDQPTRDRHLGIDFWGPVNTPIYAPLDGKVHSVANNDLPLDYGYTLILEHEHDGLQFFTLYGHLAKDGLASHAPGMPIKKGTPIAQFGAIHENGGWAPHLHFQLILDLEGNIGDYPGVCAVEDIDHYRDNCPDPYCLFLSFLEGAT